MKHVQTLSMEAALDLIEENKDSEGFQRFEGGGYEIFRFNTAAGERRLLIGTAFGDLDLYEIE